MEIMLLKPRPLSHSWLLLLMMMMMMVMVVVMMSGGGDAAKIQTYNGPSCDGSPTNTFYVVGNTCQIFNDEGAVQISEIDANTRVSVHNQRACEAYDSVAQIYGPGCVVKGATELRAVWIQG